MRALVAAGADPSTKLADGTTLLLATAAGGRVGAVKYALEIDPRIDAITNSGATVMHAAVTAANGRSPAEICEVIQFLADKGAQLDERDAAGRTPRQIANRVPIANAGPLLTSLITKSGATPKAVIPR